MTRPRRNEGEEERRLRERKESRYRDGSESDSEEERRLAEAERKRNARKRRPTANIPECSSTSEQPSNVTNSNIAISRSAPEEGTPKTRPQQSRRPPVMEDPPNIGSQPGTSTECNQIGKNKDERAKEDSRIPEELNEREIVTGPSTSLNLSETRHEKNRLAQQKYRQRRKEQQREDELNRIREQTRQRLTLHRQRLNQEQEGQIRQQDREVHSEQRQSESDSEEERRLAEAERKRNARKRRPTANIPECSSTSEQPSNVTNSNIAISRSAPEEGTPKTRPQQSRRPPVMEDPPNIGSQPGTSTECNQIGKNKDERAKEDSRIPEELNEREIVTGPSTSLNLSETRHEKNRLAQQKYRQRRKEQQREDELNRIREQTRQRLTLHRQRLNQEQEGQIRQQDREVHSEQRQRLTQEQQDQIRQQNRTAHSEQRQRLTQEQQDQIRQQDRTAHSEQRQRLTQEQQDQIRQQDRTAHSEQRQRLTQEQQDQIRQQDRTAHSEQRQRLTQEQQDQIRQQNRTAHSEQRQSQTPQRRLTTNARRRVVVANRRRQLRLGREYEEDPLEYHCGSLSLPCSHCGAFYFPGEQHRHPDGTYNPCCRNGKVTLPLFPPKNCDGSSPLIALNFAGFSNTLGTTILHYPSRRWNARLVKIDRVTGRGPNVFKVHGEIRHFTSPAIPSNGRTPSYGQLFFIDESVAVDARMCNKANQSCCPMLMTELTRIITANHEFAAHFQMLRDTYQEEESKARQDNRPMHDVRLVFHSTNTPDPRRYNAPRVPEVAVVYVGPDGEVPQPFDYVVKAKGGDSFSRIPIIHKILDPSIYPLFFLQGQFGWHPKIYKNGSTSTVSQKDFYCWFLSLRDVFNPVHYGRMLFQQFLVGSWINTEQCRLSFIRKNQTVLRSEFYNEVQEFIAEGHSGGVGSKIVLPASFTSSPRYMLAQYHDAMTITARFGKPDLFLTFTCNPKWHEIVDNLKDKQTPSDRPDLVARVFRMKLDELLKDIYEREIFGAITAFIYTVEWQKRGLPHAHMLFTLASADKPQSPEDVDSMISAEIPALPSRLRDLVATHMIHRDCGPGSPCWVDGKCSKKFSKAYQDTTDMDKDGYPAYRRKNDNITVTVTVGNHSKDYGNEWVVPHCPYLLLNAHINLEICSVIHATKYLYKYVYKGSDKARLELRQQRTDENGVVDEVAEHLDARYVCAPEAFHRLFAFNLHGRSNPVIELAIHEEGRHTIYFQEGEERRALERNQTTTLLAFFEMNRLARELKASNRAQEIGSVDPHQILYNQFPEHFTYDKRAGKWKIKGHANRNIGRIHSVYPSQEERYCIRQLLLHKTGDCSFLELFTVAGVQYRTAKEAAVELGLIRNTDHFNRAMQDANLFRLPYALRSVFACLLSFDGTIYALEMFEKWKTPMAEDYIHSQRYTETECFALTYFDIVDMCTNLTVRTSFQQKVQPPLPTRPQLQQNIRAVDHTQIGEEMYTKLNPTQLTAVDAILSGSKKLVFLDGPGGSGKTFTYECIYHTLRGRNKSVVCTAWTGIAANLLPEGRTVASYFKLNIDDDCATTRLKPNTQEGRDIAQVDVFVIDECSMISHKVLSSIDKALRDMTNVNNEAFGGKTILIGGDFRQVLPIPNNLLGQTAYQCCLKTNTDLYEQFHTYHLNENMRAVNGSLEFKNFLLSVGDDTAPKDDDDKIVIPSEMLSNGNLIDEIFDGGFDNVDDLSSRAILSPKNVNVEQLNEKILNKMQGDTKIFYSVDSIDQLTEDKLQLSEEFLHSLRPANLPPHKLELKIGCIVMLIRNLNVKQGLCNGTRLQVDLFGRMNAIQCRFINGVRKGETVIIPRIDLMSSKGRGMSFVLTRRQFPFKLAFAMTINKAQGQSLDKVGIYLPTEVFSHGQLYVALSRAKTSQGIKVFIKDNNNRTLNIVDRRAL